MKRFFCISMMLLAVASLAGEPAPVVPEPVPTPEEELRAFQMADGFEVSLFAAEPLINNPIQMAFDPRGRLWVTCSLAYPQIKPGEPANDKIVILTDDNGDGKADRGDVFADGLLIPTGIALGDGGAYVANGPELLHLKDTNGDGKADTREVLFSGFGTGDSHQNINTFTWGPGGELYFSQGWSIFSRIETRQGIKILNRAGAWRLQPRTLMLDPIIGNESFANHANPWGFIFDPWGQAVLADGSGMGLYYMNCLAGKQKSSQVSPKVLQTTKYCGIDYISGRHMPDELQGRMVGNAFMINQVDLYEVGDDGAGISFKALAPIMKTASRVFRPVCAKFGPDGALYILDWAKPIIGHYQYSFRDPRRDNTCGRVWRITAKNRPLLKPQNLEALALPELLDLLKVPENFTRDQVRRVLYDRDANQCAAALQEWLHKLERTDANYEHHCLEALWSYQTIDIVNQDLLVSLLRSGNFRVRAAATKALGLWHDRVTDPLRLLQEMIQDDHPRVRMEAVVALSFIPATRSVEIAAQALDKPMDRYLTYALQTTAETLKDHWLPAVTSGALTFDNNPAKLEFVLSAAGLSAVLKPLLALLENPLTPAASRDNLLPVIAKLGGAAELAVLLKEELYTDNGNYNTAAHARILELLLTAAKVRRVIPEGDLSQALYGFLKSDAPALQTMAIRLVGPWKVEFLHQGIINLANGRPGREHLQSVAIEALAEMSGDAARNTLVALAENAKTPRIQIAALTALAAHDLNAAATRAAALLAGKMPDQDAADLFGAFLKRDGGAEALADAFTAKAPAQDAARTALRLMGAIGRQDPELLKVLNKAADFQDEAPPLSDAELAQLAKEVKEQGDIVRGEEVFRQAYTNCLSCHAIGGAGGKIGPDLALVGSAQSIEYLIGAVLYPDKEVKEGYNSMLVVTKDGRMLQGYKVREDKQALVLWDVATAAEVQIAADDIRKKVQKGSVMPKNLVANLTRAELRDMVRFLSELGRQGPLAASNAQLVRFWMVAPVAAAEFAAIEAPGVAWNPLFSRADGLLAWGDLPKNSFVAAKANIDVSAGGEFKMLLNDVAGTRAWLDGRPVDLKPEMPLTLQTGRHSLYFLFELQGARAGKGLRVEFTEAKGSKGRLQVNHAQ